MQSTDVEVWRPIPNHEGYEASNLGHIRSIGRYIMCKGRQWRPGHVFNYQMSLSIQGENRHWDEWILEAFGVHVDWTSEFVLHCDNEESNNCITNLKVQPIRDDSKEWRDVVGWEGHYIVSNYGDVVRLPRIQHHSTNNSIKLYGCIMKPQLDADGYLRIGLSAKGKKTELRGVHQLVAKAFIANPDNKPTVNHLNGNKQDNSINNLEWATYQEQSDHAVATGLRTPDTYKNRESVKKRLSHPVRCVQTGEVFPSMIEAERRLGLYSGAVLSSIQKQTIVTNKKLSFERC